MTDETNQHDMECLLFEAKVEAEHQLNVVLAEIWLKFGSCDLEEKGLLINKINQVLREMKV